MGAESFAKNMEKGLIEVAPLAYMRGRTLDNAYIILDEAQNTTPAQMKMFLTRIGFGSKDVYKRQDEMKAVAGNRYVTTDDGSYGRSGMVTQTITDLINEGKHYDCLLYTSGRKTDPRYSH